MSIPRGTTPTFTLTFTEDNLDLTTAQNVYVTFKSGTSKITKTGADLEIGEKTIAVYLTQANTLSLDVGVVKIQANWTTANGSRVASEVIEYPITEQLLLKELR